MGRRWAEDALTGRERRITNHATRTAIVGRYGAGESCAKIGADLGLSRSTVRNVLIDAGVQLRPGGRRPAS